MRAIHQVTVIKHTHNQHITNINNKDTTTIKSTYKPVHLHMKYQGERTLINECKSQPGMGLPRTT